MPGTQCPEQGGAFKEPRANGFQEAADCQVKGLPVHPLSFFWGKVADEGIWPDSNRGSCSSGKQPPPPARRVCLHKSTRFFHTPLAAAGKEIYWELLAWLFRSFLAVTAFAFVVAGYQTLRSRPRRGRSRKK